LSERPGKFVLIGQLHMECPIRVILADDNAMIRRGIRRILEITPDISVAGEAQNGQEAINLVDQVDANLLILDIQMPVVDGLTAACRLRDASNPICILILSGYANPEFIEAALEIGVNGYLLKDEAPGCLVDVIRSIIAGECGLFSQKLLANYKPSPKIHSVPCGS
jgi:DNA-binding NarL/FixJ family response regulator